MSQSYYKVIDGHRYDGEMIGLADEAVAGRRDGRISLADAKLLLAGVKDANKYTDVEKATMHYIRDHYRFTPAADKWFRTQIRSWAASRGWRKRSADKGTAAAVGDKAESAPVVESPPPIHPIEAPDARDAEEEPREQPPAAARPPREGVVPPEGEAAAPGGQRGRLIPFVLGAAIVLVIAVTVWWPTSPTLMDAPEKDAPPSSTQAEPTVAPATVADTSEANAHSASVTVESAVVPPTVAATPEIDVASSSSRVEPEATPPAGAATPDKDVAPLSTRANSVVLPPPAVEAAPAVATPPAEQELAAVHTAENAARLEQPESQNAEPVPAEEPARTAAAATHAAPVPREETIAGAAPPTAADETYRVKPGDSLWKISAHWYGDPWLWPRIYRANEERISNPDIIHPKSQLVLPGRP